MVPSRDLHISGRGCGRYGRGDRNALLQERTSRWIEGCRIRFESACTRKSSRTSEMPDDKTKTGRPDRDRINTSESYELRD
jgi:hypothetical protein